MWQRLLSNFVESIVVWLLLLGNFGVKMSLNPDHLLKDELEFEVRVRGGNHKQVVMELRREFRELVRDKQPCVWQDDMVLARELEVCKVKLEEWEASEEDWKTTSLPTGSERNRAISKVLHVLSRVKLVAAESSLPAGELVTLTEGVVRLEALLGVLVAGRKTQVELDDSNKKNVESEGNGSSTSMETGSQRVSSEDSAHNSSVVTTSAVLSSPLTGVTTTYTSSGSRGDSVTVMSSSASQPQQVSQLVGPPSSANYSRLPNPLLPVLQGLPHVDGLNVDNVLRFLGGALRMKSFPGVRDGDLLMILMGYVSPPLSDRLAAVVQGKGSFEVFHREILSFCIPSRMLETLKMTYFYRPQRLGECMANFVTEVREAGRVLLLGFSEEQTVQTILEGLAPEERSRLSMTPVPRDFRELDLLCLTSQNISLVDQQRVGLPKTDLTVPPLLAGVQAQSFHPRPRSADQLRNPTPGDGAVEDRRRHFVCYGCGKPGHTRRFCRSRPMEQPVGFSAASSSRQTSNGAKNSATGGDSA